MPFSLLLAMVIKYVIGVLLALMLANCKSQEVPDSAAVTKNSTTNELVYLQKPLISQKEVQELWNRAQDFSSFHKAILRAKPYDTIHIPQGVYRLNNTIAIHTDHLTIKGDQTTLITRKKQNIFKAVNINGFSLVSISAVSQVRSNAVLINKIGGSDLNLKNCHTNNIGLLRLLKNEEGNIHQNLRISDCGTSNAGTDGIKLQGVDGFLVENSMFLNSQGDGIKTNLAPCKNGVIYGCYFEGNDDDAFDLFGGGSDIVIDSCKFVDQKLQLKNIGGKYFRPEISNCTVRRSIFINSSIICLSKYLPGTEFNGLHGIKIDSNTWINKSNSCFQTNGAVNYQFTANHMILTDFQKALDVRPPLGKGEITNNIIESKIDRLVTDPKKGTYLLETKAQTDPKFGIRDENSNLIISGNTFKNGRRDFKLEGLANFEVLNNESIGQFDKSIYQGVLKVTDAPRGSKFKRKIQGNVIKGRR